MRLLTYDLLIDFIENFPKSQQSTTKKLGSPLCDNPKMYYEIAKKNNMEKNDAEKNSVENLGDI